LGNRSALLRIFLRLSTRLEHATWSYSSTAGYHAAMAGRARNLLEVRFGFPGTTEPSWRRAPHQPGGGKSIPVEDVLVAFAQDG